MGDSSLLRLLGIRRAEEELSRTSMERAMAELHRLRRALEDARGRARSGRMLIASSAGSQDSESRVAGLEETAIAERMTSLLIQKIDRAEQQISDLRQRFQTKRIERRQAEILVDARKAQEAIEDNRRAQAALDDWHRGSQNSNVAHRNGQGNNEATGKLNPSTGEKEP